jgi:DEAD/DEAH box helicase domain-containing protein
MKVHDILSDLRRNRDFMSQVVAWERFPEKMAATAPFPRQLPPGLVQALQQRGIRQLYTHQEAAISAVFSGADVVIATPTASGKSLCYTIPVLSHLLSEPTARALYLFPTKALAHDQLAETQELLAAGDLPLLAHSYDGDTPQSKRRQVRRSPGIIFSNPDMLHSGILPTHPGWRDLFANLQFVVLDEIHTYRGVFGSHVANVLRRLRRLCEFYGSSPLFICCSATIANPKEHAERLLERPFVLVDERQNGAPSGEKQFLLYNPPIINEELGLRASTVLSAKDAAMTFLAGDVQTIVFARARQTVELLLAYLQDDLSYEGHQALVAGYRGGYLPNERHVIEAGLRDGSVRGVVATNALELGIDIGQLDVSILTGYPGSISSTWQQAGRAGRRADISAAILVAGNGALDQYICNHPRYLFGRSPENALINPDNLRILVKHLLCAAFEMPFKEGEPFGAFDQVAPVLDILTEEGALHRTRAHYHWIGDGTPAVSVSLRTSGAETVVIQDIGEPTPVVIGEVDLESAPLLVYEGAIYMHQAVTYLVEALDWDGRIAYVRPVDVDYYTRSSMGSTIRELRPEEETTNNGLLVAHGEVSVITSATGYRKIKRYSHETLGYGEIDLPDILLETTGYWMVFEPELAEKLWEEGILARPNDYGPNWREQRRKALERDGYRCRTCGANGGSGGISLHVHHIRPFRDYNYIPGANENYLHANQIDNLVSLCPSCHGRAEAGQQTRSALGGLAYVMQNLAPLFLMCDVSDIMVSAESLNPLTKSPTLVIYERVAAGVGFSQRLYELHDQLLDAALELVSDCRCRDGCPACVGPPGEIGPQTKPATKKLLQYLIQEEKGSQITPTSSNTQSE